MVSLHCPLCKSEFEANTQGIVCINGHQFDRAKEGYFNLLPVQYKNSREPGDAKEQLKSRRKFLQSGFFDPLKTALLDLMDDSVNSLADLGCGEGYFTHAIANYLPATDIYAVDISKSGVAMAAKSAKSFSNLTHIVASNFDLPLQDNSMDRIIRILAPGKDAELQRLLKPNGKLILVIPGEQHLIELREKIYQEVRPLQALPTIEGFTLTGKTTIQFALELEKPEQVQSLIDMTPFAWKLNQDKKIFLSSEKLSDTADFLVGEYRKL